MLCVWGGGARGRWGGDQIGGVLAGNCYIDTHTNTHVRAHTHKHTHTQTLFLSHTHDSDRPQRESAGGKPSGSPRPICKHFPRGRRALRSGAPLQPSHPPHTRSPRAVLRRLPSPPPALCCQQSRIYSRRVWGLPGGCGRAGGVCGGSGLFRIYSVRAGYTCFVLYFYYFC
jgi:hypothetical protein